MRYSITLFLCLVAAVISAQTQTAVFNWADPGSLTPAFEAPTSADRYGPYIGDTIFTTSEGVSFDIDDSKVKELSQKARFLYGYLTESVELRVYPQSSIIISAPEGKVITSIAFAGAKADDNYMDYVGENGQFKGNIWTATGSGASSVMFSISTTINCTSTTVIIGEDADVNDITYESDSGIWFGIDGSRFNTEPVVPGIYIHSINGRTSKILIR